MFRCDKCIHRDECVRVPNGCECYELDIEEHDKQIRADERAKVLEELRLRMKDRADDCSDIPNMFDKGYYKAYEHMCKEIEMLKEPK